MENRNLKVLIEDETWISIYILKSERKEYSNLFGGYRWRMIYVNVPLSPCELLVLFCLNEKAAPVFQTNTKWSEVRRVFRLTCVGARATSDDMPNLFPVCMMPTVFSAVNPKVNWENNNYELFIYELDLSWTKLMQVNTFHVIKKWAFDFFSTHIP